MSKHVYNWCCPQCHTFIEHVDKEVLADLRRDHKQGHGIYNDSHFQRVTLLNTKTKKQQDILARKDLYPVEGGS